MDAGHSSTRMMGIGPRRAGIRDGQGLAALEREGAGGPRRADAPCRTPKLGRGRAMTRAMERGRERSAAGRCDRVRTWADWRDPGVERAMRAAWEGRC
ncbi:hypothetical protein LG3211_1088 [Lysobacter gummosus]|nr:hypothetical protein LG3211_1088 [Lysobacter gummosus]